MVLKPITFQNKTAEDPQFKGHSILAGITIIKILKIKASLHPTLTLLRLYTITRQRIQASHLISKTDPHYLRYFHIQLAENLSLADGPVDKR